MNGAQRMLDDVDARHGQHHSVLRTDRVRVLRGKFVDAARELVEILAELRILRVVPGSARARERHSAAPIDRARDSRRRPSIPPPFRAIHRTDAAAGRHGCASAPSRARRTSTRDRLRRCAERRSDPRGFLFSGQQPSATRGGRLPQETRNYSCARHRAMSVITPPTSTGLPHSCPIIGATSSTAPVVQNCSCPSELPSRSNLTRVETPAQLARNGGRGIDHINLGPSNLPNQRADERIVCASKHEDVRAFVDERAHIAFHERPCFLGVELPFFNLVGQPRAGLNQKLDVAPRSSRAASPCSGSTVSLSSPAHPRRAIVFSMRQA